MKSRGKKSVETTVKRGCLQKAGAGDAVDLVGGEDLVGGMQCEVGMVLEKIFDNCIVFFAYGGAGRVDKPSSGADEAGASCEDFRLPSGEVGQILGLAAPADFGVPAEGPQS